MGSRRYKNAQSSTRCSRERLEAIRATIKEKWKDKSCCVPVMECHTVVKMDGLHASTRINIRKIMLSPRRLIYNIFFSKGKK